MTLIQTLAKQSLKEKGLEGLGLTMPVLSPQWVADAQTDPDISFDEDNLMLSSTDHNWTAPFPGLITQTGSPDHPVPVSLQKADGSMVNEPGAVLRLFPQSILRLKRLLAQKTETENGLTPLRAQGEVTRPVPAYAFFGGDPGSSFISGSIYTGLDTGIAGSLSFYDEQGYIIHPLYVASLVRVLLHSYPALKADDSATDQLDHLLGLSSAARLVRLVQGDGSPYSGDHLEGITVKNVNAGLFTLDDSDDDTLAGEIKRAEATADDGEFPESTTSKLLLANSCYGRMLDKVSLPKMAIETTADPNWPYDFFTVAVLDLRTYLTGTAHEEFNGTKLEPKTTVRLNQNLELLPHGNALLGHAQRILEGSPSKSFVVSPAIDAHLPLPSGPEAVLWPDFPAAPDGLTPTPDDAGFPPDFKAQLQSHGRAAFITDGSGAQPTGVLLTLTGLPTGAAVRVFNRKFGQEATLSRGDGAGGTSFTEAAPAAGRTFNGEVMLVLQDPLGLRRPEGTVTVPRDPALIFDLMVVCPNPRHKKLFGALTIPITGPETTAPSPAAANLFGSATHRAVCNAPVLGLSHPNPGSFDFSGFENFLNSILVFSGETQPRDAARQPTMARRETVIASRKDSTWEGLLSGGLLDGSMHHAQQDLGCPGSPGGRENAAAAILVKGQLAYDLGRMAFRRTTSLYDRIVPLGESDWAEPDPSPALGASESPNETSGLFAGALLQTISPYCETPELALLKPLIETDLDSIPENLADFIDSLIQKVEDFELDTAGLPEFISEGVTSLKTKLVEKINELRTDSGTTLDALERGYQEIKRELSASIYGRRDTQWALAQGIAQARKYIYLETPGFSFTQGSTEEPYSLDLVNQLKVKLEENPGIKLIICVPKQPDYGDTYDLWKRSEVTKRYALLQQFPAKQLVVFHPVGFPGRSSNISTTTMVIDDCWALVGAGSFRRRGLTFDGAVDLVLTGLERVQGKNPGIALFRKTLMAQRLGINPEDKANTRTILLEDFAASFALIRETLVAGGLGKIERLWSGHTPGQTEEEPNIHEDLVNPEGLEFNSLGALIFTSFIGLAK